MESHLVVLGSVTSAITQIPKGSGVLVPAPGLPSITITSTAGHGKDNYSFYSEVLVKLKKLCQSQYLPKPTSDSYKMGHLEGQAATAAMPSYRCKVRQIKPLHLRGLKQQQRLVGLPLMGFNEISMRHPLSDSSMHLFGTCCGISAWLPCPGGQRAMSPWASFPRGTGILHGTDILHAAIQYTPSR